LPEAVAPTPFGPLAESAPASATSRMALPKLCMDGGEGKIVEACRGRRRGNDSASSSDRATNDDGSGDWAHGKGRFLAREGARLCWTADG